MSHTPLPWYSNRKHEIGSRSQSDDQSDEMLLPLADVYGDNREADISLILASVNERPALLRRVEELEAALREVETICLENNSDCRKRMGTRVGNCLVAARAALSTTNLCTDSSDRGGGQ